MEANNAMVVDIMEKELYVAAMNGDIEFLQTLERGNEYLLRKTHEKNNIIHIAIRHEQHDFIEACLRKFPNNYELICEKNSKQNTPFHVAADVGNLNVVSLLYDFVEERIVGGPEEGDEKPWRAKNLKGNTPVHVAIIHDNVKIARFLLEKDSYLAQAINNFNEAPLHLAIKHHVNYSESESIITKIKQPIEEGGVELVLNKFVIGEDMSSLINFLVEKGRQVACWPDANGFTPLHKAASLSMPYNIQVLRSILHHCPQSAEVFDSTGKSILHLLVGKMPDYQQGKKLLNFKSIKALRNHQDQQGNTPLHIATKYMDIIMVRVLLENSAKLSIKNTEGVSAASLIQQHKLLEMLRIRKMSKEEAEAIENKNINFLRERLSKLQMGNFLLLQDTKGKNILHKLMHMKNESHIMQDDLVDFIQQILERFPTLICQKDHNEDTPVHILVRNNPETIVYAASGSQDDTKQTVDFNVLLLALLKLCNLSSLKIKEESIAKGYRYDSPWLVQNSKGNTPLHEALISNNSKLVKNLLTHEPEAATLVNKCSETPLHLLAGHHLVNNIKPYERQEIESMVNANKEAANQIDKNGLTPLLRAFEAGNLFTAAILFVVSPEAANGKDGQTFWHLLVKHPSTYYFDRLLRNENESLRSLLKSKDSEHGNTALHLAIQNNRFDIVRVFLDVWQSERGSSSKEKRQWLVDLLKVQNKAGKTPGDLIAESRSLPPEIEDSLGEKYELIGIRSMWGIPTTQMKTYVNTMGIIAALLTTITFTAAFAVPGGLIQDKGTPVLIKKVAFQVFMIADLIAMCLSMMVLFCLLWIMATNKRHYSVIILDFSVTLLLASFYATLVTFMTGLFATMFTVKPWIAIVTVVLCSLLMLLVHKFLVIKLLIPFRRAIWKFLRFARNSCTKITGRRNAKASEKGVNDQALTRQGSVTINVNSL